jgi:hypothetical protein
MLRFDLFFFFVSSDLSYNNLSGPVPRFAAKTFR